MRGCENIYADTTAALLGALSKQALRVDLGYTCVLVCGIRTTDVSLGASFRLTESQAVSQDRS